MKFQVDFYEKSYEVSEFEKISWWIGSEIRTLPSFLSGQAKIDKMKEAEEYRAKAKKALSRTLFSSPDPIAGAMFYSRAMPQKRTNNAERIVSNVSIALPVPIVKWVMMGMPLPHRNIHVLRN